MKYMAYSLAMVWYFVSIINGNNSVPNWLLLVVAFFSLMGCSTQPKVVKVPVAVECPKPVLPPKPHLPIKDLNENSGPADFVRLCLASVKAASDDSAMCRNAYE